LQANMVDLNQTALIRGPWLDFDLNIPEITAVDGTVAEEKLQSSNFLLKDVYRPPYQINNEI
jgi:hypothetical protein